MQAADAELLSSFSRHLTESFPARKTARRISRTSGRLPRGVSKTYVSHDVARCLRVAVQYFAARCVLYKLPFDSPVIFSDHGCVVLSVCLSAVAVSLSVVVGIWMVDLFCRVMQARSDDVVGHEQPRTQEENEIANRVVYFLFVCLFCFVCAVLHFLAFCSLKLHRCCCFF